MKKNQIQKLRRASDPQEHMQRASDPQEHLQRENLESKNAKLLNSCLRLLKSIKRDTAALIRFTIEPTGRNAPGSTNLPEARLRQVLRVAEVMQNHPEYTLHRACQVVLENMPLEGGYNCVGGLYRYCNLHSYDARS